MMATVRLINSLLGVVTCGQCEGCTRPRCHRCILCREGGTCLDTVCIRGLSRMQKKAIRAKQSVLQEDDDRRLATNRRLMTEVYIRATRDC